MAIIDCPNCGEKISSNRRECQYCGHESQPKWKGENKAAIFLRATGRGICVAFWGGSVASKLTNITIVAVVLVAIVLLGLNCWDGDSAETPVPISETALTAKSESTPVSEPAQSTEPPPVRAASDEETINIITNILDKAVREQDQSDVLMETMATAENHRKLIGWTPEEKSDTDSLGRVVKAHYKNMSNGNFRDCYYRESMFFITTIDPGAYTDIFHLSRAQMQSLNIPYDEYSLAMSNTIRNGKAEPVELMDFAPDKVTGDMCANVKLKISFGSEHFFVKIFWTYCKYPGSEMGVWLVCPSEKVMELFTAQAAKVGAEQADSEKWE